MVDGSLLSIGISNKRIGGKIVEEEGFYSYINFYFDAFIYFDSFFKFISELGFSLREL